MIISTGYACLILLTGFITLVVARVPVAFALGIATIPLVVFDIRLTPFLIMDRMFNSYNSFILLAVPFFLLAANLMNGGKITDKLIEFARVLTGWLTQRLIWNLAHRISMNLLLHYARQPYEFF